jgi:quinol monooxygenase YgiN
MATILAHIRIKPGCEARYEELASELYRQTHAKETKVRRYEVFRGAEPGSYYTLLSFDDYVGFLEHQSSDHHEDFGAAWRDLVAGVELQWVDPVQTASTLSPTATQPAPADAPELMRTYAERMPAQVAEWWGPLRG